MNEIISFIGPILGVIGFLFFGLGFIIFFIRFTFKKQRDKQTIKLLAASVVMLVMCITLININDDTKSTPETADSTQQINTNAPIPEQIDEHIKKL